MTKQLLTKQLCFLAILLFPAFVAAQDWRTEANARIEQHRKENITLFVTAEGKPLTGATVTVEMVNHEFLFGSNIFLAQNPDRQPAQQLADYHQRFAELLNFATLPFYWASYESVRGQPNYAHSERIVEWCKEQGIRTKGHPLVWNTSDPHWIKEMPIDDLYRVQIDRVTACVERLRGKIDTWDVINEVSEWSRPTMINQVPKLTELGQMKGEIELAKASFAAARKANPEAILLINDYIVDDRYAAVVEKLVDDSGKPLYDVIGIQGHMHSGTWNNARIWEVCERFAKFNVPLHFTELTILSTDEARNWWGENSNNQGAQTTPAGELKQAEEVERIYTMLFSHPSVEAITWWDFSDSGAWMRAPAGFLRRDMTPKPAYEVLKTLIKEKWATNVTVKTDDSGEVPLRAFRGEYRFIVTLSDGSKKVTEPKQRIQKGTEKIVLEWK